MGILGDWDIGGMMLSCLSRWIHTFVFFHGFLRITCPLCSRGFWERDKRSGTLRYYPSRGKRVCPRCVVDGTLEREQSKLDNVSSL